MLRFLLRPIVVHTLPAWPVLPHDDREVVVEDTLTHVAGAIGSAPLVLRTGIFGLTLAFRIAAWGYGRGRGFGRLNFIQRDQFFARWAALGPAARSFERLIRSLCVVAALEHQVSKRALGLESDETRRDTMRQTRATLLAGQSGATPSLQSQSEPAGSVTPPESG